MILRFYHLFHTSSCTRLFTVLFPLTPSTPPHLLTLQTQLCCSSCQSMPHYKCRKNTWTHSPVLRWMHKKTKWPSAVHRADSALQAKPGSADRTWQRKKYQVKKHYYLFHRNLLGSLHIHCQDYYSCHYGHQTVLGHNLDPGSSGMYGKRW